MGVRSGKSSLGMRRSKVETFLPEADFRDGSWRGIHSSAQFRRHGIDEWYYLSRHFICELTYAYTGTTSDFETEVKREARQKLLSQPRIVQVVRPASEKRVFPPF